MWMLNMLISELLLKNCAVTIHTKNLQILMTKRSTRKGLKTSSREEIFCETTTYYSLRNNNKFIQPRVRSVNNPTICVRFKGQ